MSLTRQLSRKKMADADCMACC